MRRYTLAVTIAIAGVCALAVPGSALARFRGNLCPIVTKGELAAAHISAPCKKVKATRVAAPTPLGTLKTELFLSEWGATGTDPGHGLAIHLQRIGGSPAVVSYAKKRLSHEVIQNGAPVGIGSFSSWSGMTSSCENPPTGDCTFTTVEAIVKNYELIVLLDDFPLTGTGEAPPEDDPQDLVQEEADKGPAVAIAKTIAKAL